MHAPMTPKHLEPEALAPTVGRTPDFLKALVAPQQFGWPVNPYLRVPILAWVLLDPSEDAQRLAREVWDGFPKEVQEHARALLKATF
jgi:hypothetical protein